MQELLERQNKHLAAIEALLKTDRLMQLAQTYGIHNIDQEDYAASRTLDHISGAIDNSITEQHRDSEHSVTTSTVNSGKVVKAIVDSSRLSNTTTKAHTEALKKIQDGLDKNNNLRAIAENQLKTPATTDIVDKFKNTILGIGDWAKRTKQSMSSSTGELTAGSIIRGPLKAIGVAVSPKYEKQQEYIKNERNLGNTNTDKELKANFKENSQYQQRNERNERNMDLARGTLSKEEYLKGNSPHAQSYQKEQLAVGVGLKKTDSRLRLDDEPEVDEKADYVRNEKNLGNKKRTSTLEKNFGVRGLLQDRNVANEERLTAARGSLTEDEFLSGNQKEAKAYKKEQQAIGKGLEKVDSRYTLGRSKSSMEEATSIIGSSISSEASQIRPMVNANLSSEDRNEAAFTSREYQDAQLDNNVEQTKIFEDQLTTQKDILKAVVEIKDKPVAECGGSGIGSALGAAADMVGNAGGMLKKAGGIATKVAGAAAIPLAVGVAGAAALNLAANTFSDSFGEGGFDVVKKLQDDKIIDYNATIAGFNPSEVLDWEGIQKLKPEDLKKLLDSGVEFSPEDTSKLHKIYTQSMITGGKESNATKAEAVVPEAPKAVVPEAPKAVVPEAPKAVVPEAPTAGAVVPEAPKAGVPEAPKAVVPEAPTAGAVVPETIQPSEGNALYSGSKNNVQLGTPSPQSAPTVISAPTVNTSNQTVNKSVIKVPVTNPDRTYNSYMKYVS